MMRAAWTLAAGVMFAGGGVPQDLAPEVLLLSRVKRRVDEESKHLPNVTCLETIERDYQPAGGKLRRLDTVRLEVLTDGHKELYASPGDRKFSEGHPIRYVGGGTLGNGLFGLYLRDILVSSNATFTYKGEEKAGGRSLARYDYRLPLVWSGQIIRLPEGSGRVGLSGSVWADPQTYDVVRLKMSAEDFPPSLPLAEAVTTIRYAPTQLGDRAVLLPESAELHLAKFSGERHHNRIEFTHCRAFEAESAIRFDAPDSPQPEPRFAVASVDDTLRPLPGGLEIQVNLRSRITGGMAVGTLIDAVVAGNVTLNGAVVIARGAPVRGRIRRLEAYTDPFPHFVVALEFTEVELQGIRHRFYADLADIDSGHGVALTLETPTRVQTAHLAELGQEVKSSRERLTLPSLPGVAAFFVKGDKLNLQPGFQTVWRTRSLAP